VTAKFFIGAWVSPVISGRTRDNLFTYAGRDACQELPQGDDIVARYESYAASGAVVKQDSITIRIFACPARGF
jgi:hypothetical protein